MVMNVQKGGDCMPKVYILNRSGHDFSSAEKFGELKFVNEGHYNIFNIGAVVTLLRNNLISPFKVEEDFLVMSGSPMVAAIAFSLLIPMKGSVNVLLFDAKQKVYTNRTITLSPYKKREEISNVGGKGSPSVPGK